MDGAREVASHSEGMDLMDEISGVGEAGRGEGPEDGLARSMDILSKVGSCVALSLCLFCDHAIDSNAAI